MPDAEAKKQTESQPAPDNPTHMALIVDVWKYSVGVQMHFNDMGMKIRNLYFTILAAALGLLGVVQGKRIAIPYPDVRIHLAVMVILAIVPVSMLFYFLDRHWYHRLLLGAVKQCAFIEGKYKHVLPEIQLGAAISKESPVPFEGHWRKLFWFVSEPRYRDKTNSRLHSDAKLEVLYKSVIWAAILILVVYLIVGGIEFHRCSILAMTFRQPCVRGL